MELVEGSNLVGGHWAPALEGGTFELRALTEPFEVVARWPRSGPEDGVRALEATSAAAEAWAGAGRVRRIERLRRLPDALEGRLPTGELAAGLGVEENELGACLQEELFRLRETLEILADGGVEESGGGVFQAHWSDGVGRLAARVLVPLAAGRTALLFASPRLPAAARAVAEAAEEIGCGDGVLSVLNDDTGEALRAALSEPGLAWARLCGTDEALAGLEERLGAWPEGASVWPLRGAVHGVLEDADPAREAALVVEKGLGRSSTLTGQMPGQVGRVVCHQRLFSRFSEELLQCLEAAPDAQRPVPDIEGDLPEHVRRAWALGLDEGATPIFGAEPLARPVAQAEPNGARPPLAVPPVVFTNVEPGLRLAGLGRPSPVLSLIRGTSDEEVRGLVAELEARGRTPRQKRPRNQRNEGSQA